MTNEPAVKAAPRKGKVAKQVGGLGMVLGVILALAAGSVTAIAGILFFAGLVSLIVGGAMSDTDKT